MRPVEPPTRAEDELEFGRLLERLIGEVTQAVVSPNARVVFGEAPQDTEAFFTVRTEPALAELLLNTEHPLHEHLRVVFSADGEVEPAEVLRERVRHAAATLRLLLYAWLRYEVAERSGTRREAVGDARRTWGKLARELLRGDADTSFVADEASGSTVAGPLVQFPRPLLARAKPSVPGRNGQATRMSFEDSQPDPGLRQEVLDLALKVVAASGPISAKDIVGRLVHLDARIDRHLVNSVLHREGGRRVEYDQTTRRYRLRAGTR